MKVTWNVSGNIMLKHNDPTIGNAFPDPVPLKDVKVKVSAREKLLGVWGPFNKWDEVTTNSNGFFKVVKEKDKSDRQFKIEVMFKDDTLKIYPENDGLISKITEGVTDLTGLTGDLLEDGVQQLLEQTSRIAFDVKWFKVLDEDKNDKDHNEGTINFGNLVFGGSSKADLGDYFAIRHAITWFVIKKVFDVINTFVAKCKFDDKKPVALKYPHDNKLIGDKIEAPYSDPYNYVIFVIKNSTSNWFSVDTIIHELMHIWAYQHCSGEKSMAWQLLLHGSTHDGLQNKSFVAFHEGFAEWASNRLTKMIFSTDSDIYGGNEFDTGLPFSRKFLKGKGIKKESDIDKSEYGWISLFNILMTPDLHLYNFNSTTNYAEKLSTVSIPKGHICSSPALTFEEILSIFCENESKGYKKVLDKNEMNADDFLQRAKNIVKLTSNHISAVMNLLDPSKTNAAVDKICLDPTPPKPPKDLKIPPKDLHEPPIKSNKK